MDKEVVWAQVAMDNPSAMDVGNGFDRLPEQPLAERQWYGVALAVEEVLETAVACLSEKQSRRKRFVRKTQSSRYCKGGYGNMI